MDQLTASQNLFLVCLFIDLFISQSCYNTSLVAGTEINDGFAIFC